MLSLLFKNKCKVSEPEIPSDSDQYEWSEIACDGEVCDVKVDEQPTQNEEDGEFVQVGIFFVKKVHLTMVKEGFHIELPDDVANRFLLRERPTTSRPTQSSVMIQERKNEDWTGDVKVSTKSDITWGEVTETDINNGTVALVFKQVRGSLEHIEASMHKLRLIRCPTMFKVKGIMLVLHDLMLCLDSSLEANPRPWASNGEKKVVQSDCLHDPQLVQCLAAINGKVRALDFHVNEIMATMDGPSASAPDYRPSIANWEVLKLLGVIGGICHDLDQLRFEMMSYIKDTDIGENPNSRIVFSHHRGKTQDSPTVRARCELVLIGDQVHLFAGTLTRILESLPSSEMGAYIAKLMEDILIGIYCVAFSKESEAIRAMMAPGPGHPPLTVNFLTRLQKNIQKAHREFSWAHSDLCQQHRQPSYICTKLFGRDSKGVEALVILRGLFYRLAQGKHGLTRGV